MVLPYINMNPPRVYTCSLSPPPTSLPIPYYFLTCIQISQEAGQVVWYSHLLTSFPWFVVIHTVKGFGVVNKAEVEFLLELSCFVNDPIDVGNLISGSSAFYESSFNLWKFSVHVLLKTGLEDFEHYLASVWNEYNYMTVWTFFGTALFWDWNESWRFPVLWPLLSFQNHWHIELPFSSVQLLSHVQLCTTHRRQPTMLRHSWVLQARTLEWVAISFSNAWKWKVKMNSLSCVQINDPMDCSLPGSSIHGISQARVLEWAAIAFSLLACEMSAIVQ